MTVDKEELEEYKEKLHIMYSFKNEANEYKKKAIFSGIVAGLGMLLNLNQIIALTSSDNTTIHFIGVMGYSVLTAIGLYYNAIMKDKQSDCEEVVSNLKENLNSSEHTL